MPTQVFTVSGSFTVPTYATILKIKMWGGGASGGSVGTDTRNGNAGGDTTFNGLIAKGGLPGTHGYFVVGQGGLGQTPTGGDVNTPGNNGITGSLAPANGGAGASAPSGGGAGGFGGAANLGTGGAASAPGGGGGGAGGVSPNAQGPGGGGASGAYVEKTYLPGDLVPGASFAAVVGQGGAAVSGTSSASGAGARGEIRIEWDVVAPTPPPTGSGPVLYKSAGEVSASVPVTQGNSAIWRTVYQMQLPDLRAGQLLLATIECEVRNDAGYNIEFVTETLLCPSPPSDIDAPPGALMIGRRNGHNVDPIMHYYAPDKTWFYVVPQDLTAPWLVFRVRARSTSATGNEICTIMQGYGELSAVLFS